MDYPALNQIPAETRRQMRLTGRVGPIGGTTRFFCQEYRHEGPLVILSNVIVDTSDRVNGATLETRWSHSDKMYVAHQPVTFRPMEQDEREALTKERSNADVQEERLAAAT